MTGTVFDIKECSVHDGPGVRTTVFFKGCPLKCIWCHNPEGLNKEPCVMVKHTLCKRCGLCFKGCDHEECRSFERCIHACPNGAISLAGKEYDAEELAKIILKNKVFFDATGGGVTFSGGEPLMQYEFLIEVLSKLGNIHTAIETSGYVKTEIFSRVLKNVSYVMMDLKLFDNEAHKKFCSVSNEIILENAKVLMDSGIDFEFRTPIIPGITDTDENLSRIQHFTKGFKWEKIPYNNLAGLKYPMVGMEHKYDKYVLEEMKNESDS